MLPAGIGRGDERMENACIIIIAFDRESKKTGSGLFERHVRIITKKDILNFYGFIKPTEL